VKIAVVGSGISGLSCAYLLKKNHDITLFESSNKPGGHVNTVKTQGKSGDFQIDTGFIVFNRENYPNFVRLLDLLNIPSQSTRMGFSVQSDALNLEYSGENIIGLFGHFRNLIDPKHWNMVRDILRFHDIAKDNSNPDETVDSFLKDIVLANGFLTILCFPSGQPYGPAQRINLATSPWSSSLTFSLIIKCYRQTTGQFGGCSKEARAPTWINWSISLATA
jgi:predicted NAD/FAD-binding protein